MGADIHIHVETRKNGKCKWELFTGKHFTPSYSFDTEKSSSPFDWRSYSMFGFLAGVRSNVKPIKEPSYKLPIDVSIAVKSNWIGWEGDGHTISFVTLRELVEFDFNQDLRTPEQEFSTNSRNVIFEKISFPREYDEDWEDKTYYDIIGGPDGTFCKHIEELSELGNLDDVRIVFWFDN